MGGRPVKGKQRSKLKFLPLIKHFRKEKPYFGFECAGKYLRLFTRPGKSVCVQGNANTRSLINYTIKRQRFTLSTFQQLNINKCYFN